MNVRESAQKAIPQNAPEWVKKSPITTLTTVISTIAGVVAIAAWLGFSPPTVLAADKVYVTHEQFNLLLVNLIESVEDMDEQVDALQKDLAMLTELSHALEAPMVEEMPAMAAPAMAAPAMAAPVRPNPAAELLGITEPEPEPIVLLPPEPSVTVRPEVDSAKERLKNARKQIERLQLEQRTIR